MRKPDGKKLFFFLLPGMVTAGILTFLLFWCRFAPFGNSTLAVVDAHIQYLDFFMHLKNVLSGDSHIAYTFGQMLGDCNVAVFSYYLASPLNLLIVFFSKENLHVFFHLLVVCKLALSAITFRIFILERYEGRIKEAAAGMLSASYALCQYNIAQCSNVMWLDGVYMLPLLLLGVYKAVNGKSGCMLALSTGASMLFNWYTGVINCLFTAVWLCVEGGIFLFINNKQRTAPVAERYKRFVRIALRYAAAMAVGVLLSMALFLPTLAALRGGKGEIEWEAFTLGITGEFPSIVQAYVLGGTSSYGRASLFCGSVPVVACIGCFFTGHISKKEKTAVASLLAGVILMFYWKPCFFVFSLFRRAESYYYRYSYLGIFALLFIAAFFFSRCRGRERARALLRGAGLFSLLLVTLHYVHPVQDTGFTYATACSALILTSLIALHARYGAKMKAAPLLLAAAVIAELMGNVSLLMKAYHAENVADYRMYVKNGQRQTDEILNMDPGVYRISQTKTRSEESDHLTANYNEALAYGYRSISGYTSDPDDKQIEFLDRMGYAASIGMNIVNTSVLAADSLLGVKYLLSPFPVNGMELVGELPERNGKRVYQNPFCLPFAFRYRKTDGADVGEGNPFEYQNGLYRQLLGEETQLYQPVPYYTEQASEFEVSYRLEIPKGNCAVYGNLPWGRNMDAALNVNGAYETGYAKWLSPSVFYIPTSGQDLAADVRLTAAQPLSVADAQFYALDLDRMAQAAEKITKAAAEEIQVEDGYAKFLVDDAKDLESLYLSIPYDGGWKVTVNGKPAQAERFEGCMMSVPLQAGKNVVEMEYRVPYLGVGVLFSIAGIAMFVLLLRRESLC